MPSKEFRIVLIALYQYGSFGVRFISDVLKTHDYKVYNIFFKQNKVNLMKLPTEREKRILIDLIKEIDPDIVGISVRSTFFPVAKDITSLLHGCLRVPVIWGGVHPIICPEESIESTDMICVGEGERPMVELVERMSQGRDISGIGGLWVRKGASVEKNDCQLLIDNLDSLPLPAFDNDNYYAVENDLLHKGNLYYTDNLTHYLFMGARGCPYSCTFCSNSVLREIFKDKGPFVRQRSVENVIKELVLAKKRFKKMRFVATNDEIFCLNKAWIREFCARYKHEINLPLHCDIHPDYVNEETISMLRNAGLRTVSVGIQSGSERTRKQIYGRDTPDEKLRKMAGIFKKYKIYPSYDLIFDNPLEALSDIKTTLRFMMSLPRPYGLNMYSLQCHPRTKLTERLLGDKLVVRSDLDGVSSKGFDQWHVIYDNSGEKRESTFLYKLFLLLSSSICFSKKDPSKAIAVFPKWFINFLWNNNFSRRYHILTDWVTLLPRLTLGLSLLIRMDFSRIWIFIRRKISI